MAGTVRKLEVELINLAKPIITPLENRTLSKSIISLLLFESALKIPSQLNDKRK